MTNVADPFEGAPLDLDVKGLDEWLDGLDKFRQRARGPFREKKTALRIRTAFTLEETRLFITRNSGRWAQLTPRYRAYKERVRPSRPIMVFDGDLARSLNDESDPNFIYQVSKKGDKLTLGSKDPKAKFHQLGTKRMRARPLLILTKKMAADYAALVAADLYRNLFARVF